MRTGRDYVEALKDDRAVYLDGQRVADVTEHPGFAEPIRQVAMVYDALRERAEREGLLYTDEQGERFPAMWLIPRSSADIAARRRLHRVWAEASYGHMGRTPDHVACVLTAFAASREFFARGGTHFGENVVRFYDKARREDLYVTYAIVPPQIDRSQPAHRQPEPFLYPGVVGERDGGIVVRGAEQIATSAVMADWILVSYITPLQRGDDDYAITIVVPCNAPGLRLYPRRPYATMATSTYDYPLSSRFDEADCFVVLDDVFVPWEQVFVYKNVDLVNGQFQNDTPSHVLANFQSLVRFCVKLEFAAGLAQRLTELHATDTNPAVQAHLGGEIAGVCATMEALVDAAQNSPQMLGGVARPHPQFVYTGMSVQRRAVVDFMRNIRELAGGALLAVPSSEASFRSEETGPDTRRYYRGAKASAEERVKVLKLLWDLIGTEFAGRQLQYEMFYSAAQAVVNTRLYRSYDWNRCRELVDRCLREY